MTLATAAARAMVWSEAIHVLRTLCLQKPVRIEDLAAIAQA